MSYDIEEELKNLYGLYELTKIFSKIMPTIPTLEEIKEDLINLEKLAEERNIDYVEVKKCISNDKWRNSAIKKLFRNTC